MLGRVADGVAEVRRAAREEIKAGARFIKIMANGGIASPTDPIPFLGYSREEIAAAVEEAESAGTYVLAHLHTDNTIRRGGVRRAIRRARQPRDAGDRAAYEGEGRLRGPYSRHL